MKIFKNIFGAIWAVWGIAIFITTLFIFIIPFCICFLWDEPRRSKISYPIFRVWMNIYLPMVGVFIRIYGKENFKKGKNYIVISNHNSLMDVPVLSPYIPGPNKTIAKIEMSRMPVFGIVYKLGSILVDRKDKESRVKSYMQMKQVLAIGIHMCIYPEGTRNKTGQPLKEFHDGAFRLAVDTQYEIIPAVLIGTKNILPSNKSFYFMPGIIKCHFLPSLQPGTEIGILKDKAFEIMWNYLENK
ncbi:MAG: 1-acyl-sn-glycerol-3-phosphate acyltransferase [Chitinophagaceae bacterium]|nr:1-acyl-sn-glycerol-3-phosphate acyltransferase [Chitinophagaceae bacterium]